MKEPQRPIMQIGKSGLTKNLIEQLRKHLEKRKIIKVKLLKSYLEGKNKKDAFQEVAAKTDSILVKSIGFVIILAKKE